MTFSVSVMIFSGVGNVGSALRYHCPALWSLLVIAWKCTVWALPRTLFMGYRGEPVDRRVSAEPQEREISKIKQSSFPTVVLFYVDTLALFTNCFLTLSQPTLPKQFYVTIDFWKVLSG